jgi:histidyl-tRNA synthetase
VRVSKSSLQAPRGTRDFYPEDLRRRDWLFEHFRGVARSFAFEEVDAPVLESAELFTRKAGEEIVEQLYHFELHERHYALRPEMTPSLARMVMARAGSLRLPLRWFTITQNWRYERMTRGRKREHFQWNMDVWGEPGVGAEAELIAALFALLDRLGLPREAVKVRLSSRGLLEETLRATILARRPEVFPALCVIIDKLDKIGPEAVSGLLVAPDGPVALAPADAAFLVDWLGLRSFEQAAAAAPAGSPAAASLRELFELLTIYGLADRVVFDASIVRGLAYYTGVVFEAFDAGRTLRAICGGGRYDGLIAALGGSPLPAVGFGFGDVVIQELLADLGLLPELPRQIDGVVFALGPEQREAAIQLAAALRAQGACVELMLGQPRMKRALADADKAGARRAYWVGPEELAQGVARVRDLATGEQTETPLPVTSKAQPHAASSDAGSGERL